MYTFLYTEKFLKTLKKVDKNQQRLLIKWIEKNLLNTNDPRSKGKQLKGNLKNYWRYRIGNYRLLVDIQDNKMIIIGIDYGHRKDIY